MLSLPMCILSFIFTFSLFYVGMGGRPMNGIRDGLACYSFPLLIELAFPSRNTLPVICLHSLPHVTEIHEALPSLRLPNSMDISIDCT